MKLAVYAIFRDEEANVARWLDALQPELKDGDSLTVVDTGSVDDSWQRFYQRGVMPYRATISPWRFDHARNAALALVPADADAAWSLDLDEFPQPGWRDAIDAAWHEELDRLRYKFVWSFQPDGSEGVTFFADKLHARDGFHWKGIAHEWLAVEESVYGAEEQAFAPGLVVHHHQDASIDRAARDMGLMERAIAELPNDPRLQHYYARQLFFVGRMVEASEAFQAHLANPQATWRHERSESMLYLARAGGNEAWEQQWYYRALAECPERKEVWFAVAQWEAQRGNHALALGLLDGLAGVPGDRYYLSSPQAQGEGPAKLRALILREMEGAADVLVDS